MPCWHHVWYWTRQFLHWLSLWVLQSGQCLVVHCLHQWRVHCKHIYTMHRLPCRNHLCGSVGVELRTVSQWQLCAGWDVGMHQLLGRIIHFQHECGMPSVPSRVYE